MKPFIHLNQLLTLSLFLFLSLPLKSQDWQWKWGAPNDKAFRSVQSLAPMGTDRSNRFCVAYGYSDSLFLHDTIFAHNTGKYSSNTALAFYSTDGIFDKAIDLYTIPFGNIWNAVSRTDTSGNIYIASEFQIQAILMDTVINHGPAPHAETPDVFIAKLGPDMEIKWVRLIWGSSQATIEGFTIGSDQHIYISTSHYGNGGGTEIVNYFKQDSSQFTTTIQSIMKLDPDGNLSWRKEIKSGNPGADALAFFTGEDGNIYHLSNTAHSYSIGVDTVFIPSGHPKYTQFPCVLSFNPGGELIKGLMIDNGLYLTDLKVDLAGEMFFSGKYADTAYIANDTLIAGADSIGTLLGKANANFGVYWYQTVHTKSSQTLPFFQIAPQDGDLYFAATFTRTFDFAGHTFNFGYSKKPLIGQLIPGGILEHYTIGPGSSEMYAYNLISDNCKNLLLTGMFSGIAYFGRDTLHGFFGSQYMGFLQTHAPLDPGLGNDTIVCQRIVLHTGPGFNYYSWNNGVSMADSLEVNETGWYSLTVHNENNCWATDSVFVTITIPPDRLLGNDTTIYRRDSLLLNLTVPYDHCLWSTGDTTASVILKGSDLGVGRHTIFVSIESGPCEVSDSIQVTVTGNPGLNEIDQEAFSFYPNPVDANIMILLPQGNNKVHIYDTDGKILLSLSFHDESIHCHEIDLSFLPKGVYFLQLITGQKVRFGKLIKR
jgi:hypothetical protein